MGTQTVVTGRRPHRRYYELVAQAPAKDEASRQARARKAGATYERFVKPNPTPADEGKFNIQVVEGGQVRLTPLPSQG